MRPVHELSYHYFHSHRCRKVCSSFVSDAVGSELGLDLSVTVPPDLKMLFSELVNDVWVEVGFGCGEHIVELLKRRVDIGFIGVEPFQAGMAALVEVVCKEGLCGRVRLYSGDAARLLAWLPERSVGRLYVLYPDPWPKRRHWKRRFICRENLRLMSHVLYTGAEFRFASDCSSYVNWTLVHLLADPDFYWLARVSSDWECSWAGWYPTRYEVKALSFGRSPTYLVARRL